MNPYISAPKNLLYFSLLVSVNFRLFYIFSCPYSCPSDKKYPSLKELGQFRFASLFLPPILPDITYRFHSFIAQNSSFTNHLAM